jgi:hypothetical protein
MQPALHPIGIMADSHGKNDLHAQCDHGPEGPGGEAVSSTWEMYAIHSLPISLYEAMNIPQNTTSVREGKQRERYTASQPGRASERPQKAALSLSIISPTQSIWEAFGSPTLRPLPTRLPLKGPYLSSFPCSPANDQPDFSILFRGHSHRPSILELRQGAIEKNPVQPGVDIPLDRSRRYIITVGAVETASSVLFCPGSTPCFMSRPYPGIAPEHGEKIILPTGTAASGRRTSRAAG